MNAEIPAISGASPEPPPSNLIRFDRYVLDLDRGTLRLGDDDIELRPKAFAVLRLLAENAGRLVPKDEMIAKVWAGVSVTDDSLVQCIKELRRALGPAGDGVVTTVPRRGYRLEATLKSHPVASSAPLVPPPPAGRPYRPTRVAAAAGLLLLLAALSAIAWLVPDARRSADPLAPGVRARPSIAVLPFRTVLDDNDHFADGLTEDVINGLGRFSSLIVMSRNAVQTYKGRAVTPRQVGRDLAVRYVLEGSVRRVGEQLRVTAELTDAEGGEILWSGRFDDALLHEVFDMQDRITTQVVGRLAVKVTEAEQRRAHLKPTDSMEAYDYVLRGRRAAARNDRDSNADARALLRKALDLDPRYAAAYTGLAETYRASVSRGWAPSPASALGEAERLANKALSLDDADVRAHALLGQIHIYFSRYEPALAELDRATAINPNDADAIAGRGAVLVWSGRTADGVADLEAARRIDPALTTFTRFVLALGYYLGGEYDRVIALLARNISDSPDAAYNGAVLAATYAQQGRTDDASRVVQSVHRLDPAFDLLAFGTQLHNPRDRELIQDGLRRAGF